MNKEKNGRPQRRPRIGERAERKEDLMVVDTSVWSILRQTQVKVKQPTAEELFSRTWKTERERIAQNTCKYGNVSVAEAFEKEYGVNVSEDIRKRSDVIPTDLSLGEIVELKIDRITKDGVIFDSGNYKAGFTTRNNLYRYERFRKFIPTETLRARVVEVKPDSVMVDMFGPMIEEYVIPRVKHPWLQCKLNDYQPITVKNLHLVRGGFVGQAVIPNITDWVGEDYVIDAFIPGSQIVQNTTDDFEQFEGTDVEAFIMAYSPKPFNAGMSLVCSVKNLIKHRGNLRMMEIHKWWCDNEENWEKFSEERFEGIVTGIINSSQKCGVFVEVPALEITGMVNVSADSLSEYHPGDEVTVGISGFDEKMVYNEAVGQMQHTTPFEIIDGAIKEVNVKPILKLA